MTTSAQDQQLQQDLQNELTRSNQLLRLISIELQNIKAITRSGGDLEANILENASLIEKLAKMQLIDLENLPPMKRLNIDLRDTTYQNMFYQERDTFRNSMNDSQ